MKTTKASKTNTRSRTIFFTIALTYNILLGLHLKDFLVLSPMPLTFYLISALPTLFLLFDVLYFGAFVRSSRRDSFVTKICVLAVTALILVTLIAAYDFVCKPEAPYLSNGGATLWDT